MKISVITVVFNGVNTLEDTIVSVNSQSHPNVEHIIIDGYSTDGTQDIIDRHKEKFSQVLIEPDIGIYDAMNKGLAMGTGEVVGFLNADDFFENETVLAQISDILGNSSIQACYANIVYVDPKNLNKVIRYWNSSDYEDGLFEKGWMPAHPTFYARRDIYENFGYFNLNYHFQSDYELTARFMAVEKIKTKYIPEVWVRMRLGGATNRSIVNILKGNLESYNACKKLGLKMSPIYFVTKFFMRVSQFFIRSKIG